MHATSAVAVAVVAAAGAMAVPMGPGIFARGTTSSPAIPTGSSLEAPENAFGQAPSAPINANPHDRALPTVTVFYPPKATVCKPGETPSAKRSHHKHNRGSQRGGGHNREGHHHEGHNPGRHHQEGHHQEGNNPEGHNRGDHNRDGAPRYGGHGDDVKDGALSAAPALVPRSDAPVPTGTFEKTGDSAPAPTHPPKNKNGSKRHHGPHTKTGKNGTVTVFHRDSSTPCRAAPTGVPVGGKIASYHKHKSRPKEHMKAVHTEDVVSQPNGTVNQASAPGGDDKRALVKRAVDLLERYFNDLDELD